MYHIENHCLALENTSNQFDKAKNSRCTISCPAKRECDIFVVFFSVVLLPVTVQMFTVSFLIVINIQIIGKYYLIVLIRHLLTLILMEIY